MKTLIKIWGGGLVGIVALIAIMGCSALTPTVDPNLQAEREIARAQAVTAQAKADEIRAQADLVTARGDAHVKTLQAEMSTRVVEMHEIVAADMARLNMERDNFVVAISDHQQALMNLTYIIERQYEMWERIDHNTEAAAENSWFTNMSIIVLAVVVLGLIGLVIALAMRFERKLSS